jgi:acetoin utilization deacetylase AcuC-like enzyme
MTLLYYDPLFLEHHTGKHPEHARRVTAVLQRLEAVGIADRCALRACPAATAKQLRLVHGDMYIGQVERFAQAGGGRIEVDTVVSARSYDAAVTASGAVCDAVEQVIRGTDRTALCLVRPPGHHALADAPMGFCLFNHIAIGARFATEMLRLNRVLIVDWDVHHGNGTQASFWTDSRVGFLSLHRWPFYPGTGDVSETGSGDGLGTTLNVPISFGTPADEWLALLERALQQMTEKLRPELILVSAGFDAHRQDPVGSLGLDCEHYALATKMILEAAGQFAGGRVVSVLEGGYNPAMLAACVELHLRELLSTPTFA